MPFCTQMRQKLQYAPGHPTLMNAPFTNPSSLALQDTRYQLRLWHHTLAVPLPGPSQRAIIAHFKHISSWGYLVLALPIRHVFLYRKIYVCEGRWGRLVQKMNCQWLTRRFGVSQIHFGNGVSTAQDWLFHLLLLSILGSSNKIGQQLTLETLY